MKKLLVMPLFICLSVTAHAEDNTKLATEHARCSAVAAMTGDTLVTTVHAY
ncbi:hypothetical protein [Colwellia piezophila]|uniref:hypothetical protein n=1 Tax=Colwellia piezophila TaxID=211668 RepID=UPI0003740F41|nr:hypothetical protein [Colwellia piezophila]